VLVDNGSTDGSADAIALEDDDVRIRNALNAGYGVAATQGMARARALWILLVNPDIVVAPEFLAAILGAAASAPEDVATLVPEMRYASERTRVNSRGVTVDDIGIPAEIDVGAPVSDGLEPRGVVGGSSGCCLLRARALHELGGPEPVFFAYLEDVDLALRLQRLGMHAELVPSAVAWHEGSASTGQGSPLKTFLVARNRRILFRLQGPATLRARAWRLLIDVAHGLVSSVGRSPSAPWVGRADALRLRTYTRFVRRARRRYEPAVARPPVTPRAGLRETLRRKRTVSGAYRD
jgi:GT2 family glycosyltransferase